MKTKTLGLAAALLAGTMFAAPAFADVTVLATIDKTKTIKIDESMDVNTTPVNGGGIIIRKTIDVFVDMGTAWDNGLVLRKAAEALAIANVSNHDNKTKGKDVTRKVGIGHVGQPGGSVNGNTGVVGDNQDAGNAVNQANLLAAGITSDADAFTDAEAAVDQFNSNNKVGDVIFNSTTNQRVRIPWSNINLRARIDQSINGNIGIVGVNQNAGNNNNQTNAVALAAGFGDDEDVGALALAEALLGQETSFNLVVEEGVLKVADITDSVNGNQGIVGVTQSLGNNGNQANIVAAGVATMSFGL